MGKRRKKACGDQEAVYRKDEIASQSTSGLHMHKSFNETPANVFVNTDGADVCIIRKSNVNTTENTGKLDTLKWILNVNKKIQFVKWLFKYLYLEERGFQLRIDHYVKFFMKT